MRDARGLLALMGCMVVAVLLTSGCTTTSTAETDDLRAELRQTQGQVQKLEDELALLRQRPTAVRPMPAAAPTEAVGLRKVGPKEVVVGETFTYQTAVQNQSGAAVGNVRITEHMPDGFKFQSADPEPLAVSDGKITWDLGMMEAGASKDIKVSGTLSKTGMAKYCSIASYEQPVCMQMAAIQPALKLVKTGPKDALICEPITYELAVTNTGTGTARDVRINDPLPGGMKTMAGETSGRFQVGDLTSGQTKRYTLQAKAAKTGEHVNRAVAQSAGGLKAEAQLTTFVHKPVLTITKTGPDKRFLGKEISYTITVTNEGDWEARDTVLEDTIPAQTEFVRASHGGAVRGGKVTWSLGTLAVGGSKSVNITLLAKSMGMAAQRAEAKAFCAAPVRAEVMTEIAGIPAILLEVIDVEDPIQIGQTDTYEITVTNQGSATGNNITIVCTLEPNMTYKSASGPTAETVVGNTVKFAPLATLAPGAKATWKVMVVAAKPGDVRFTVSMTSDELTRSVDETEATNFYE